MSTVQFGNIDEVIREIEASAPASAEELEQFRLRYLGSKNIIKPANGGDP